MELHQVLWAEVFNILWLTERLAPVLKEIKFTPAQIKMPSLPVMDM